MFVLSCALIGTGFLAISSAASPKGESSKGVRGGRLLSKQ